MQNSRPLLTIAIPTYNRSHFLDELLDSLAPQCSSNPNVELLVSDNNSSDDTPGVVNKYIDRGLHIRYLRNPVNVGADGNFLQCFDEAKGKYVWIVGDDDVVASHAVQQITALLQSDSYDLIYLNSYAFESSTERKPAKSYQPPTAINDAPGFARAVNIFVTFISGNIINKDSVRASHPADLSELVGTNLVQLGWMYAALNQYVRGLVIHEPLVGMRTNNTGGYALSQVFGVNLNKITESRLQDRSVAKGIINGTLMRFFPPLLLNLRRSSGSFKYEAAPDTILTPIFSKNPRYWFFIYPILKLPYPLARIWFGLLRIINKIDKETGSLLMR